MTATPTLVVTEDQEALRDVARAFLSDHMDTDVVREVMATPEGMDQDHWASVSAMGWPGLVVPEAHGGAGYGWAELAVLFEEVGRTVAPLPLLSVAMGTAVLLEHATSSQRDTHLPAVADGTLRPAVAVPVDASAPLSDDGTRLSGTVRHVVDGATADLVVVATDRGVVLVPTDRDGVTATPMDVLDPTRPQAELAFDDVGVGDDDRLVGTADAIMGRARTVGAVLVANEQVGLATAVLDMSVDYARTRRQFGRAIGSFQAIKHLLADDLVALEAARSVALARRPRPGRRRPRRTGHRDPHGRLAVQRHGREAGGRHHPGPWRHRVHVGARRPPVLQAGEFLTPVVRDPHGLAGAARAGAGAVTRR